MGGSAAPLLVLMLNQERLNLAQQIIGVHGLHQHGLSPFFLPFTAQHGEGGQNGTGWVVGGFSGGANHIVAGLGMLHLHVGDHHVVVGGLQLENGFGGGGGGFNLEAVDFQNRFQGQQNGDLIVSKKNAAFH